LLIRNKYLFFRASHHFAGNMYINATILTHNNWFIRAQLIIFNKEPIINNTASLSFQVFQVWQVWQK